MSDSYFIGTISRVHNLWRFSIPLFDVATQKPLSDDRRSSSNQNTLSQTQLASLRQSEAVSLKAMAELEKSENVSFQSSESKATVGMMVSLDHTIYFHRPREIRADEWMFSEMESPWAGDGRGLVFQRIWSKGGRLLATCVQEVSVTSALLKFFR